MHTLYPDDPTRTADHGTFRQEGTAPAEKLADHEIVGELCDLFAGRQKMAYGETLEWWMDVCAEVSAQGMAEALLPSLSEWPFDRQAATLGINAVRTALIARARSLFEVRLRDTGELPL
jgi:hypothetical protein